MCACVHVCVCACVCICVCMCASGHVCGACLHCVVCIVWCSIVGYTLVCAALVCCIVLHCAALVCCIVCSGAVNLLVCPGVAHFICVLIVLHSDVGSMYSQAHTSLSYIYWRVWLLVIKGAEKANLGSKESFFQFWLWDFGFHRSTSGWKLSVSSSKLKMDWRKRKRSQPR